MLEPQFHGFFFITFRRRTAITARSSLNDRVCIVWMKVIYFGIRFASKTICNAFCEIRSALLRQLFWKVPKNTLFIIPHNYLLCRVHDNWLWICELFEVISQETLSATLLSVTLNLKDFSKFGWSMKNYEGSFRRPFKSVKWAFKLKDFDRRPTCWERQCGTYVNNFHDHIVNIFVK